MLTGPTMFGVPLSTVIHKRLEWVLFCTIHIGGSHIGTTCVMGSSFTTKRAESASVSFTAIQASTGMVFSVVSSPVICDSSAERR